MKEYQLKLNDIEEVETTPRRRHRHNHQNNNRNTDYRPINVQYEQSHSHQHYQITNINHHNYDINRTFNESDKNIRRRNNHRPEWSEFGCKQIILMSVFLGSIIVLLISFLINLILTIKKIIFPRFFLPSIILIFLSFSFAGGIMGTYIIPPHGRRLPKIQELLLMRIMIPIIMLIVSLIFLLIGGDNITSLRNNINKAENLCKENKGLSMEEIYIKANETLNELMIKKNNLIYSYHNNLICYPNAKCVKLNKDENNYICNSQDFISDNLSKIKCDIININGTSNQLLININNHKNANLFIENCIDVYKNFFKSDNNLFKCESEYNLENIEFAKNLTENSEQKIQNYLNNRAKENANETKKNTEIVNKYENSRYNYDLECLSQTDYTMSYLIINIYLYIFYFLCIFWILFGIFSMHELINLGLEGKLNFNLNNRYDRERNNINNIDNKSEDYREVNHLINNKQ